MALISPILDNRTFEQLREELVSRIPVYTPEWTDHNESDPGSRCWSCSPTSASRCCSGSTRSPTPPSWRSCACSACSPARPQPASALLAARTELAAGVQILKGAEARAGSVTFETDRRGRTCGRSTSSASARVPAASDGSLSQGRAGAPRRRAPPTPGAGCRSFTTRRQVPADPLGAGRAAARRRADGGHVAVDRLAAQGHHRRVAARRPYGVPRRRVRRGGAPPRVCSTWPRRHADRAPGCASVEPGRRPAAHVVAAVERPVRARGRIHRLLGRRRHHQGHGHHRRGQLAAARRRCPRSTGREHPPTG